MTKTEKIPPITMPMIAPKLNEDSVEDDELFPFKIKKKHKHKYK